MADPKKLPARLESILIAEWRKYSSRQGNTLAENLDQIAARKSLEAYRQTFEQCDTAHACITLKASTLVGSSWRIDPGDPNSPASVRVAEELTGDLNALPGSFDSLLNELVVTSLIFGFAIGEVAVDLFDPGRVRIKSLRGINPSGCEFIEDETGRPVAITQQKVRGGTITCPINKVVHLTHGSLHGNAYGHSALHAAYPWHFKRLNVIQWLMCFLERLGDPALIAKVGNVSREQADQMLHTLDRASPKTSLLVPKEMEVTLLESKRDPRAVFISVIDMIDTRIARSILLPDKLGFSGGPVEGGSFSLSETHMRAWLLHCEQLRRHIEATIQEQLVRRLFELGWAGQTIAAPVFRLQPIEPEDKKQAVQLFNALVQTGTLDPGPRDSTWLREALGMPSEEKPLAPTLLRPDRAADDETGDEDSDDA